MTAAAYTNVHNAETEQLVAEYTKIPVEVIHKIARGSGAVSSDPRLIQPAMRSLRNISTFHEIFRLRNCTSSASRAAGLTP
jgi:hypothetical protein